MKIKTGMLLTIYFGTSEWFTVFITRVLPESELRRYFVKGDWVTARVKYAGKPYTDVLIDLDGTEAYVTYDGDNPLETYLTPDCYENQVYIDESAPGREASGEHQVLGLSYWEVVKG